MNNQNNHNKDTSTIASKQELRRQVFCDPPTIEVALKNYTSWFLAHHTHVHNTQNWTTHDVLRMTRLLSKCINQHICSIEEVASIWNPVQQDANRKITQTMGRVALQAVWSQLDKSTLQSNDNTEDEFIRLFEAALFAPLEQDEQARLIWSSDRGKDELTRRAVQRQAEALRRTEENKNMDQTDLSRIEEIEDE